MSGNLLGPRAWYLYTADNGDEFSYYTDVDLGTAVGATLDASNGTLPRGLKPRGVYAQDEDGNRKFIICPATTTAAYASEGSTNLTIGTVTFSTTGSRGERRRKPRNAPAATP